MMIRSGFVGFVRCGLVLGAVMCLGVATGCSKGARLSRHLEKAQKYHESGKHKEAVIEYMNVLKADPTNHVAVRGMGLSLWESGDVRSAISFLRNAEAADPGDPVVSLKIGTMFLMTGDRAQARKRAEAVLAKRPDDLDALVLWAGTAGTKDETQTAIARLLSHAGKLAHEPRYHLTLGLLHLKQGEVDKAESVYNKALAANPKTWEVHLALGDIQMVKKDLAAAEKAYVLAAECSPAASVARVRLARFYHGNGKVDAAKEVLASMLSKEPKYGPGLMCRAELAFASRDLDGAVSDLTTLLKSEPSNIDAFLLLQSVKMAQGKIDEAIAGYERIVSAFPNGAPGRYFLGMAYRQKGDMVKAIAELEKAVAANRDQPDYSRSLAELYIQTGKPDSALSLLRGLLKRNPEDAASLALEGAAHSSRRDYANAADAYRTLIKLAPRLPQGHYLLGVTLMRMKNEQEAVPLFEKTLELEPGFLDAAQQLAAIDADGGKNWNRAEKRLESLIGKAPKRAGLHYLLGNIYVAQKKWDDAERAFSRAIELEPETIGAYLGLSRIYATTGKHREALEKVDKALDVKQDDLAALMLKAVILSEMKDPGGAAAQYERIIAINANFIPALNNLACLQHEKLGKVDEAYEVAKRARKQAPKDPAVADTLGWIACTRGEYKWALTLLRESAEQLSKEPEVLYHLGICQSAMGDTESAKASLAKALESGKEFAASGEAEGMLSVLRTSDDLREMTSSDQVEAFARKHKENPHALLRAGAYYERTGAHDQAKEYYELALKRNAALVPAVVRAAKFFAGPGNDLERAMALAKQARDAVADDPDVADTLAWIAFQRGDYSWAQTMAGKTAADGALRPEQAYHRGIMSYVIGKTNAAVDLLRKAVASPEAFAASGEATQFLRRLERPQAEIASVEGLGLEKSLKPEYLPVLMAMVERYAGKEDAKARTLCEQIVGRFPDFAPAYRWLGAIYFRQASIPETAQKTLLKARELFPDDPQVGAALGLLAYAKGQHSYALQLLQASVEELPDNPKILYALGMCYHKLNKLAEAQRYLQKALVADPKSEAAPAARKVLAGSK